MDVGASEVGVAATWGSRYRNSASVAVAARPASRRVRAQIAFKRDTRATRTMQALLPRVTGRD